MVGKLKLTQVKKLLNYKLEAQKQWERQLEVMASQWINMFHVFVLTCLTFYYVLAAEL